MIQKLFSVYGTAINAGDDREFLTVFGSAAASAIQQIMANMEQDLVQTKEELKNIREQYREEARQSASGTFSSQDPQSISKDSSTSTPMSSKVEDTTNHSISSKKKKGIFGFFN